MRRKKLNIQSGYETLVMEFKMKGDAGFVTEDSTLLRVSVSAPSFPALSTNREAKMLFDVCTSTGDHSITGFDFYLWSQCVC